MLTTCPDAVRFAPAPAKYPFHPEFDHVPVQLYVRHADPYWKMKFLTMGKAPAVPTGANYELRGRPVPSELSNRTGRPARPLAAGKEPTTARVIRFPREREASGGVLRLVDQIAAGPSEDPGIGGWSGGFANQAHWDPARTRDWRCWAQSGPTWSAHCGAEVAASDPLGLCQRHRQSLFEEGADEHPPAAEAALNAG
jgi:hypothetical protein